MRPDRIFVQMSAEPNLFELCRVQPKIMKKWIGNIPTFPISEYNESLLSNCRTKKMYAIVKK